MKRRLFNILSVFSLVLFVAMGILWVRSYWVADTVTHVTPRRIGSGMAVQLTSTCGTMCLALNGTASRSESYPFFRHGGMEYHTREAQPYPGATLGFAFIYGKPDPLMFILMVVVPYWFSMSAAMILPVLWLNGARKRRRQFKRGLCLKCGYDLRASKDHCPECGTPIPAGASPGGEDKPVSRNTASALVDKPMTGAPP